MTRLALVSLTIIACLAAGPALAKPRSPVPTKYNQLTVKQQKGLDACYAWCNEHNKTLSSQAKCGSSCWDYWSQHPG